MKITMDGKYQTRGGHAVRVLCVDGPGVQPVVGIVDGADRPDTWTARGFYFIGDIEAQSDLVSAPTKHEGWISITTKHNLWSSKEECLQNELGNSPMPEGIVVAHVAWED